MAKAKATTIGEYIIEIAENYVVTVYRIPKSAIAALKDCAEKVGLVAGRTDNTQDFGRKLLKNFCNGEKSGTIGEYHIERREDNHIDVYQQYKNTKGALREISELIGFEYEDKWDTQHFGRQLVKYAEENGPFEIKKAKKEVASVTAVPVNPEALKAVNGFDLFNIELKKIDFKLTDDEIEKHRSEVDKPGVVLFSAVLADDPDFEEQKIVGVGDAADLLYDAQKTDEQYKEWGYRPGEVFYANTFDVLNSDTKFFDRFDDLGAIMASFTGDMDANYTYSGKRPALVRVKWQERDMDILYIFNADGTESDDDAPIDVDTFVQLVSAMKTNSGVAKANVHSKAQGEKTAKAAISPSLSNEELDAFYKSQFSDKEPDHYLYSCGTRGYMYDADEVQAEPIIMLDRVDVGLGLCIDDNGQVIREHYDSEEVVIAENVTSTKGRVNVRLANDEQVTELAKKAWDVFQDEERTVAISVLYYDNLYKAEFILNNPGDEDEEDEEDDW